MSERQLCHHSISSNNDGGLEKNYPRSGLVLRDNTALDANLMGTDWTGGDNVFSGNSILPVDCLFPLATSGWSEHHGCQTLWSMGPHNIYINGISIDTIHLRCNHNSLSLFRHLYISWRCGTAQLYYWVLAPGAIRFPSACTCIHFLCLHPNTDKTFSFLWPLSTDDGHAVGLFLVGLMTKSAGQTPASDRPIHSIDSSLPPHAARVNYLCAILSMRDDLWYRKAHQQSFHLLPQAMKQTMFVDVQKFLTTSLANFQFPAPETWGGNFTSNYKQK